MYVNVVVQKTSSLADNVKCGNVSVDGTLALCGWSLHYPNIFSGVLYGS